MTKCILGLMSYVVAELALSRMGVGMADLDYWIVTIGLIAGTVFLECRED